MQVPLKEMKAKKEKDGYLIAYSVTCPSCGKTTNQSFLMTETPINLTNHVNVFKIMPALKNELAVVRLDSVSGKIKDGEPYFYGRYKHLRFFDNVIQEDFHVIDYTKTL
jgi:hypothetical protein